MSAPALDGSAKMLARLYKGYQGVVSFDISGDKRFIEITEGCDHYFSERFSKAEFGQLIKELQSLHAKMED